MKYTNPNKNEREQSAERRRPLNAATASAQSVHGNSKESQTL